MPMLPLQSLVKVQPALAEGRAVPRGMLRCRRAQMNFSAHTHGTKKFASRRRQFLINVRLKHVLADKENEAQKKLASGEEKE